MARVTETGCLNGRSHALGRLAADCSRGHLDWGALSAHVHHWLMICLDEQVESPLLQLQCMPATRASTGALDAGCSEPATGQQRALNTCMLQFTEMSRRWRDRSGRFSEKRRVSPISEQTQAGRLMRAGDGLQPCSGDLKGIQGSRACIALQR
jgi:hypothetical protein